MFSETDSFNSISTRIMAGLAIKGGTNYCDIVLDDQKI